MDNKAKKKNSIVSKLFGHIGKVDNRALEIAFNILAVFCIAVFSISIVSKSLQNDTFYTIKIGQHIREFGIDYMDPFSWHDSLPYMYPHWLYDVFISLIYDYLGGYFGIYISTVVFSFILGMVIFITNKKISKNSLVSFVMSVIQMYLMMEYITARAQLITFILFVLTVFFIEKFLEKPKKRYVFALILIPILIANVHSAVFPFYFVLYLPYIGEYLVRLILDWHIVYKLRRFIINQEIKEANKKLKKANKEKRAQFQKEVASLNKQIDVLKENFDRFIIKQNDRRKNPYKLRIEKIKNVKWLMVIAIVCLFTGLLTPLRDMPYTYTWRIMQGNTTSVISEHIALTLIDSKDIMIALGLFIGVLAFSKLKIRLRDLFFVAGLTFLALATRRQVSMLVLFGGFVFARMLAELIDMFDKKATREIMDYFTSIFGETIIVIIFVVVGIFTIKPNLEAVYVNSNSYPIEATEWIKNNLDYKNIKLFNDYNYGSYLLLHDIPVFIDSRCDLYTPEFNGEYDSDSKKFKGQDIFSDVLNITGIGTYYDDKFVEYGVTHIITKSNSKLKMLMSKDAGYKEIYNDSKFTIFERVAVNNNEKNV